MKNGRIRLELYEEDVRDLLKSVECKLEVLQHKLRLDRTEELKEAYQRNLMLRAYLLIQLSVQPSACPQLPLKS